MSTNEKYEESDYASNVPHTLKSIPQWNPCYIMGSVDPQGNKVTTAKRPIGGPTSPFMMKTYQETVRELQPGQLYGFCLTPKDEIICIDVDGLPENFTDKDVPKRIREILSIVPTYVEISPSGQGLHIYYTTNKAQLSHRKDQDKSTKDFKGSVFFRNQFVTVTGNIHSTLSSNTISDISSALVENMILHTQRLETGLSASTLSNRQGLSKPSYSINDIERWLTKIPPNLSESPIQGILNRAYARFNPPITEPEDYMHWQYMAAATHYAAKAISKIDEGEDLFVQWSLRGSNDGEHSIRQKYRDNAPKYDGNDLTHLTLVSLATSVKPVWPYPKMKIVNKTPIPTDEPDTNNLLNWEALLEFYDIDLTQNEITKDLRVSALPQIQQRYFNKTYHDKLALQSSLMYFAQGNNMPKATPANAASVTQWWATQNMEQYNPIKEWIDRAQQTQPLPPDSPSWFQALWETLELHEHDIPLEPLYRSYLKKNLMGIIRAHYYTGQYGSTTGIVILQGGENTRKSSWINLLLPHKFKEYIFPSQAELSKNAKEVSLEAGVCQIWLKDEVEAFISGNRFMKNADGALKSFLVQSHDAYRPLFAMKPIQVQRKCIFFGTTNEQELALSSTGNRRIQIIPIKFCDTTQLADIPIIKVYQELLNEFLATPQHLQPKLWMLTKEEEQLTNDINYSERKLESGGDIQIQSVYDFSKPFDINQYCGPGGRIVYSKLHSAKNIAKEIALATGEQISSSALKHILKRQIGRWSDSMKSVAYNNWSLEYGLMKYRNKGKIKQQGYVMPPLVSAFDELKAEEKLE